MMKKNYLAPCAEVMLFAPSESIASSKPWWNWSWENYTVSEGVSATGGQTLINEVSDKPWDYNGKQLPY